MNKNVCLECPAILACTTGNALFHYASSDASLVVCLKGNAGRRPLLENVLIVFKGREAMLGCPRSDKYFVKIATNHAALALRD